VRKSAQQARFLQFKNFLESIIYASLKRIGEKNE
jgi:hypothetical protein